MKILRFEKRLKTCEEPCSEREVSSCGECDQRDGEVYVKVVGDDGDDVHVTHDPSVGSLHDGGLDDVRVHVDQRQKVQAERGCQTAKEGAGKEESVPEKMAITV